MRNYKRTSPYLQDWRTNCSTPGDANILHHKSTGWAAYMSGAVGEIDSNNSIAANKASSTCY
jgi:hypothetical protein